RSATDCLCPRESQFCPGTLVSEVTSACLRMPVRSFYVRYVRIMERARIHSRQLRLMGRGWGGGSGVGAGEGGRERGGGGGGGGVGGRGRGRDYSRLAATVAPSS